MWFIQGTIPSRGSFRDGAIFGACPAEMWGLLSFGEAKESKES